MAGAAYLQTRDGRPPRVAVVDGNAMTAAITALLVEQFGCTAFSAPTGEAALALLRREEPIDLVLIDLAMTDMDGIVASQLIRALGPGGDIPILPFAADRSEVTGPRGRAAGFAGCVLKPYSPRELYAAMHMALDRTPVRVTAF